MSAGWRANTSFRSTLRPSWSSSANVGNVAPSLSAWWRTPSSASISNEIKLAIDGPTRSRHVLAMFRSFSWNVISSARFQRHVQDDVGRATAVFKPSLGRVTQGHHRCRRWLLLPLPRQHGIEHGHDEEREDRADRHARCDYQADGKAG